MTRPGPYDPKAGTVHVLSEKCSTCIFRPGNLMDLKPGRVRDMVDESLAGESVITCHQTLRANPYGAEPAACRGFIDAHGKKVPAIRYAVATGVLVEDAPPTKTKEA